MKRLVLLISILLFASTLHGAYEDYPLQKEAIDYQKVNNKYILWWVYYSDEDRICHTLYPLDKESIQLQQEDREFIMWWMNWSDEERIC